MATSNIPQPSPKIIPFPDPAATGTVTQARLGYVVSLRRQADELKAKVADAESEIQDALEAGAQVEPGILTSYLKTTERRTPAWRKVVERELGKEYTEKILALTTPTKSVKLVVTA